MANFFFTLAHFCETHGPVPLLYTRNSLDPIADAPGKNTNSTCISCQMIVPNIDDAEYFKTKTDQDMWFISSNHSWDTVINEKLKAIVVRSLSEEANSKICFFGDTNLAYSLARCFELKDSLARGKFRKYAVIITCENQNQLLDNSARVNRFFHYLIKYIHKQQQRQQYRQRSEDGPVSTRSSHLAATQSVENLEQSTDSLSGSSSAEINSEYSDFSEVVRNQKILLRNLADILNDDEIYLKFHLIAVNFLRELYSFKNYS